MSLKVTLHNRKGVIKDLRRDVTTQTKDTETIRKRQIVSALRKVTPIDTGKARAGWAVTRTGLENPVKYIQKLNQGSSKQAPAFFIESTILRFRDVHPSGIIVRYR